ncbi:UTP:RNA uridylyltransferase 1 [Gastrolobium bilobum]|uniref:UTP:RNA uridylyltransferase 1 n=1 Tax=Gastrolobium bilobum TaxID=150636 RepID=UPI002AB0C0BB|nr:UTP:RNA uridylyltransferase 1 [Gastrolobium bilobum]
MNGGGGDLPPPSSNGGEFLLSLIQGPRHHPHQPHHPPPPPPPPQQSPAVDPAVAIMGPTIPVAASPWPSNGPDHPQPHHHHHLQHHLPMWSHTLSLPYPPNFFGLPHDPFHHTRVPGNHLLATPIPFGDDLRILGFPIEGNNNNNNSNSNSSININNDINQRVDAFVQQQKQQELKLKFGSLPPVAYAAPEVSSNVDSLLNSKFHTSYNGFDRNLHVDPKVNPNSNSTGNAVLHGGDRDFVEQERSGVGSFRSVGATPETSRAPPPGFGNKPRGKGYWGSGTGRKGPEGSDVRVVVVGSGELAGRNESLYTKKESVRTVSGERSNTRGNVAREMGPIERLDHPGIEDSRSNFRSGIVEDGVRDKYKGVRRSKMEGDSGRGDADADVLGEKLADSLLLEVESDDKNNSGQRRSTREKDARSSDSRGQQLLSQRARMYKRQMLCRRDIDSLNAPFLAIYESLIPPEEEKLKQKQLLVLLEKLVNEEWPTARLYLYGSCANSFDVSKSDIDVCLAIEEAGMEKSQIIIKLADILQSDNLQNVQALTRARVPIVKLMDPVTGISCDICINNLLAVVNTRLLRDYGCIDLRLRQLAFIIKHWAKSRGVNETYHGTLSSYAYVLMCIHFLQQRRPAILPCLQEMEATYSVTVDDIDCAYFDQVEKLSDFGRHNKETISQLVWGFFYYWAYCHDYANAVISVRTGSIISKREKDWTRRIGNDRHLICIEDPFEISHDLGRVVDKHSIKVLREEFERAADIMQYDPNPCVKLFEPYVRS